jgi:hypothetical protein
LPAPSRPAIANCVTALNVIDTFSRRSVTTLLTVVNDPVPTFRRTE